MKVPARNHKTNMHGACSTPPIQSPSRRAPTVAGSSGRGTDTYRRRRLSLWGGEASGSPSPSLRRESPVAPVAGCGATASPAHLSKPTKSAAPAVVPEDQRLVVCVAQRVEASCHHQRRRGRAALLQDFRQRALDEDQVRSCSALAVRLDPVEATRRRHGAPARDLRVGTVGTHEVVLASARADTAPGRPGEAVRCAGCFPAPRPGLCALQNSLAHIPMWVTDQKLLIARGQGSAIQRCHPAR